MTNTLLALEKRLVPKVVLHTSCARMANARNDQQFVMATHVTIAKEWIAGKMATGAVFCCC